MLQRAHHYGLLIAAAWLAGCSGGPSEAQMTEAVKGLVNQQQAALQSASGGMFSGMARAMAAEITAVRKIGCKEDGQNAYLCDVEIEGKQGGQPFKKVTNMRMVKTSSGWTMAL